ncbi:MAG TPA: protein phosphatase 2C domain-containing protein [Pseudonocardia sp.]|nr:protein phosphatase 2C domain-containing protein [Pseudonocardia sp.]
MTTTLRSAAGSDVGQRRPVNQDSAYTSPRVLAVADGMGGHAYGEVASSVAVRAIADLDEELAHVDLAQVDLLPTLGEAVTEAARRLTALAERDPSLRGTGTTLIAVIVDGTRIGVAHIGDSRAYLLRDGELHQLTRDHTLVQALVDEGTISAEEAIDHPRRSILVRTLQDSSVPEPDLFAVEGRVGDRFLLCSDGVTAVLDDAAIRRVVSEVAEPAEVVARLIALANDGGGPDNITAVVADLVEAQVPAAGEPVVVGAAAEQG